MKILRNLSTAAALCGVTFLTGCATGPMASPYHVTAYKPHNPDKVSVKVSTSTQNIYVKEGDRLLMAVQGTVGEHNATPSGSFRIFNKIKNKRSGSFGFTRSGGPADIHKGQSVAVGYPMAYWCEFAPGYGFHQGFVWSIPRTHGCIRLHKEAAARLFQLVKIGTPVNIAHTQPEDAQYGKLVRKLDQRNDPDPPTSLLMSDRYFTDPPGPLLIEE
jgi:lipoprotein-anchoring transpeptidase ErfK/SrfK